MDKHQLLRNDSRQLRMSIYAAMAAVCVFVVSLLASIITSHAFERQARAEGELRFQKIADANTAAVKARLLSYETVLQGTRGLFEASQYVANHQWQRYVSALNVFNAYPGKAGIAYVPKIARADLPAYIKHRQYERGSGFKVFPTADRDYYYPLHYLSNPSGTVESIIGYDNVADPRRADAIRIAENTGAMSVSGPIRLAQDPEELKSIVTFVPVYHLTDERKIAGHVSGAFRLQTFLSGVGEQKHLYRYEVYDGDDKEGELLSLPVATRDTYSTKDTPIISTTNILKFGGRQWFFRYWSTPAFSSHLTTAQAGLILAGGCITSVLVFLLLLALIVSRHRSRVHEYQFRTIAENSNDITAVLDDQFRCRYVSQSSHRLLGVEANDMIGKKLDEWLHPDDLPGIREVLEQAVIKQQLPASLSPFRVLDGRQQMLDMDGTITYTDRMPTLGVFVINCRNITELKKLEIQLQQMAMYDNLTGLANRKLFADLLAQAMLGQNRNPQNHALLYVDLDNFKYVNDQFGHDVGDQLLVTVAQRLKESVRQTDAVARVGGDEFNILLSHLHTPDDAMTVAHNIIEHFTAPIWLADTEVYVSCSIGVALLDGHLATPQDAMNAADMAMYEMKRSGKSGVVLYDQQMTLQRQHDLERVEKIRHALTVGEFVLYYQPKFALDTGKIQGFEALVRWRNADGSYTMPAEFIPLCERYSLVSQLGSWVLEEAFAEQYRLHQEGIKLPVSINVAVAQVISGDLPHQLSVLLEKYSIDPALIELEITESMLIDDLERMTFRLQEIRQLGVKLAIDDFGSGYSGLNHLKALPVDVVKIDSSFVRNTPHDSADCEIVNAIISMSHALQLKVVAEGIETQEQLSFLQVLGCDSGQGFLISEALPASELVAFYRQSMGTAVDSGLSSASAS